MYYTICIYCVLYAVVLYRALVRTMYQALVTA